MNTIMKGVLLLAGLTGIAGSAMADKTWSSDPSPSWPPRNQSYYREAPPLRAEQSQASRKAYRLYRAPRAHVKPHVR